jgi:hypothetical protein
MYSHFLKLIEAAAATLVIETGAFPVRADGDIERAISAIAAAPNGGLIVQPDGYTSANRTRIIELVAQHRLPAVYAYRYVVAEGGLASYGPHWFELYRQSAAYVDRVLRARSPRICRCSSGSRKVDHATSQRFKSLSASPRIPGMQLSSWSIYGNELRQSPCMVCWAITQS